MIDSGLVDAADWLPPLDQSGPPVSEPECPASADAARIDEEPAWLDEAAAWAAAADFGSGLLTVFGTLDPARLSDAGRVDALVAAERLQAWAAAQAVRLLAAMAPAPATRADREWVRDEIALAARQPPGLVSARIRNARELVGRLPATVALLESGTISAAHADVLAGATAPLDDAAAAQVQARVLPRAPEQNLSAFRAAVRRAVHAADTRAAEERHQQALLDRRVVATPLDEGMGELWARLSLDELAWVMGRIDHTARQTPNDPTDPHSMDHRRADALVELILGGVVPAGATRQHDGGRGDGDDYGARTAPDPASGAAASRPQDRGPAIQVVLSADTLLGLDDLPGELDGYGPIPATMARALAFDPTGTLRRLLVEPVTRKVLDFGRRTYEPPQALADYVRARDRRCRFPRCTRRARPCEIDHKLAWDDTGHTAPDNCQCLCRRHHHAKHEGGWTVFGNPEDELTWVSPTGHTYRDPPASYASFFPPLDAEPVRAADQSADPDEPRNPNAPDEPDHPAAPDDPDEPAPF